MKTLVRRALGAAMATATTVTALVVVQAPAHAAFTSAVGGVITRSEVIERAQYWVDHQPGPYSDSGLDYSPDPTGSRNYRRDCSGLVDMAWHLNSDQATQYMSEVSYEISRTDLLPGDILNDYDHHVILFDQWESDHVHFSYYSFGSTPVKHVPRVSMNDAQFDGHPNSEYVARRYNKIAEDPIMSIGGSGGRVATAMHVSGQVEVYAVTPSGGVQNRFETTPGGAWSGWSGFGPTGTVKQVAAARHAGGRIEVYAVMSDGSIQNKFETTPGGAWSGWNSWAPAGTASSINVGVHTSGQVEVYAVTPSGGVQNRFETVPDGAWSGWYGFGPTGTVQSVATSRHAGGRVEVYAVMSDGSIQNKFETTPGGAWSGWNGWAPAGTVNTAGTPGVLAVGVHTSGQVELYDVTATGGVQNRFETVADGAWSGWSGFGPTGAVKSLTASRHADGKVEVYAVMSDGSIQNKFETTPGGAWSGWNGWAPAGTAIA